MILKLINFHYRCCTAVVSSCREMFGSFLLTSATLVFKNLPLIFKCFLLKILKKTFKNFALKRLFVLSCPRKVRIKSSHCGPYRLGYTRITMADTMRSERVTWSKSEKVRLSSDCTLQLECMKVESLVIADQHAAVNTFPGLVHTARHTMGVGFTRRRCANLLGGSRPRWVQRLG